LLARRKKAAARSPWGEPLASAKSRLRSASKKSGHSSA
jgi:hypothetical protein